MNAREKLKQMIREADEAELRRITECLAIILQAKATDAKEREA